jgi:hypothetical protein
MQTRRYGKILERTIFDGNEIVEHKDYAEIIIYNIKHKEVARAIIDLKDVGICKKHKWYLDGRGYVATNKKGWLGLHRLLLNDQLTKEKPQVDHINGNKLDNRGNNLRICNNTENNRNQKTALGISFNKSSKKWHTYIILNGRMKHLGLFENKNVALKIRREAELKYFKEFAK